GKRDVSLKVRDVDQVRFGTEDIDLSSVEQLIEPGQLKAIAAAMVYAQQHYLDGRQSLSEVLDGVMADIKAGGLDIVSDRVPGDLVGFRRFELAAAINRLRTLRILT
ncbi:MAG: ATPase, partial [Cyanobacteria bacterium J06639_16]